MFDISDLFRIAAAEHLLYKLVVISFVITWIEEFEFIPMIIEYLLKDIPSWSEFSFHG